MQHDPIEPNRTELMLKKLKFEILKNPQKSQKNPRDLNLVPKEASQWEESIGTTYEPIRWKQKGLKAEKPVFEIFQKILKNRKKILESSTWAQKKRINERNKMVYNMYNITPKKYDF